MQKKTIKILTTVLFAVMTLMFTLPTYAAEPTDNTLTLTEAIKKALANSITLRNGQLALDTTEIQRDHAKYANKGFSLVDYDANPQDASNFKTYYGLESEYRNAEKKLEADKKQLTIDVTTKYHEVLKDQYNIQSLKISYAKNILKHSQAQSKYDVGLLTSADLLEAETQLVTANTSIKEAEAKLDNAYKELNKLTGMEMTARPQLEQIIKFEPVKLDPEIETLKVLNNSYEMWKAQEAARTAGITKYFEYWSDIGINYEAQANNGVNEVRETMKVTVYGICNYLQTLEENYKKLDQQIKQLEERLRVLKLQKEVGLITPDAVMSAEEGLVQAKNGQTTIASDYATNLMKLKKLTGELPVDTK